MATPRDIRRLAFQTLFQLDARGEVDAQAILATLPGAGEFTPREREKAFEFALAAYRDREASDRELAELAPQWPVHRLAAVDRAILRLAIHEMARVGTPTKIVVSEAVELAKEFSTDKSPAFVNGLLDKVLKRVDAARSAGGASESAHA